MRDLPRKIVHPGREFFESGQANRDYDFIDRDPLFRTHLGSDTRLASLVDRMRRDVEAQRERARQRGLLEVDSLLVSAKE